MERLQLNYHAVVFIYRLEGKY